MVTRRYLELLETRALCAEISKLVVKPLVAVDRLANCKLPEISFPEESDSIRQTEASTSPVKGRFGRVTVVALGYTSSKSGVAASRVVGGVPSSHLPNILLSQVVYVAEE
jgi:hypothetical protein